MVVVGLIAFFADLIFWSSWGPGYARRTYVEQGPGYGPVTASRWGYGRRRVIEEEEGGGPRGPGYAGRLTEVRTDSGRYGPPVAPT